MARKILKFDGKMVECQRSGRSCAREQKILSHQYEYIGAREKSLQDELSSLSL